MIEKGGGWRRFRDWPIVATALVAEISDWREIRWGRNLSAWIGLVAKYDRRQGQARGHHHTGQSILAMATRCRRERGRIVRLVVP